MIYMQLFWCFIQIGLFSIGGGYAAMPLIQNQVVDQYGWLSAVEFADIITIAEMTPGPIAINCATFVGIRIAGVGGAIIATLGCVLPASIIVLMFAFFYYKYKNLTLFQGVLGTVKPAIVGFIGSAGLSLLLASIFEGAHSILLSARIDYIAVALVVMALIMLRKFQMNPIKIMLSCGFTGMVFYLI